MLFIMYHFLEKAIVFFELGKAVSFSNLSSFRISAMISAAVLKMLNLSYFENFN